MTKIYYRFFPEITVLTVMCFLCSTIACSQTCLNISVKVEEIPIRNEDLVIKLISENEIFLAKIDDQKFCFSLVDTTNMPFELIIENSEGVLLSDILYPKLLKLFYEGTSWTLKVDRRPIKKSQYPRVKRWYGIDVVTTLTIKSNDSDDLAIIYRRNSKGEYIR
ncbi:hypothetical protein DQQ10_21555 [Pseudochryseolinea flava]|uniref:Uncharacterized protein n=1 Tax=Pseudochryseolinea flava TaxID=2059302 RepID=A0A364XWX9_9BACT|nr:hypothetical protein DQQ10_21555 [Pseudochryseolinea flava]